MRCAAARDWRKGREEKAMAAAASLAHPIPLDMTKQFGGGLREFRTGDRRVEWQALLSSDKVLSVTRSIQNAPISPHLTA